MMNDAVIDFRVQSFCRHVSSLLLCRFIRRKLVYNMVFNLLRSSQVVFSTRYTILQSHQKYMSIPVSPHTFQHLLFVFLIIAILLGLKQYFIVNLFFNIFYIFYFYFVLNFLMTNETENFFQYVFNQHISLVKCLFSPFIRHIIPLFPFLPPNLKLKKIPFLRQVFSV